MSEAEFVPDVEALRYILERQGYHVIEGDFIRGDGSRARLAVLPVNPEPMLKAALDACRFQAQRVADKQNLQVRLIDGSND